MEVDRANLALAFVALGVVIVSQTVILLDIDRGQDDSLPIEGIWIPVIGENVAVDDKGNVIRIPMDHYIVTSMLTCERAEGNFFTVSTGVDGSTQFNGIWDEAGYQSYRVDYGEEGYRTSHVYFFISGNYMMAHYVYYEEITNLHKETGIMSTYYCRNGFVGDDCEIRDDGTFIVNGKVVTFGTEIAIPMKSDETWNASRAYTIDDDGYRDLMDYNYTFTYKTSVRGISTFVCDFQEDGQNQRVTFTSVPVDNNSSVNIGLLKGDILIDHMDISKGYICTSSSMYSSAVEMAIHSVAYAPEQRDIPYILDAKTLEGKKLTGAASEYAGGEVIEGMITLTIDTVVADSINCKIKIGSQVDPAEFRLICVNDPDNLYVLCNEQVLLTSKGETDVSTVMILDKSLSRASLFMNGVSQDGQSIVIAVENFEYG